MEGLSLPLYRYHSHVIRHVLPPVLHDLMEACWSDHPLGRPRLKEICQVLYKQVLQLNQVCDKDQSQSQQSASGKDSGQGTTSVRSTNTWPMTNLRTSFRRTTVPMVADHRKQHQAHLDDLRIVGDVYICGFNQTQFFSKIYPEFEFFETIV